MEFIIDTVTVCQQPERAKIGFNLTAAKTFNRTFCFEAVADQVGNGADLEIVLLRKRLNDKAW